MKEFPLKELNPTGQTAFLYTWANTHVTELIIIKDADITQLGVARDLEQQGNYFTAEKLYKQFGRTIKPAAFRSMLKDLPEHFSQEERCYEIRMYVTGLMVKIGINCFKEGQTDAYNATYRAADALKAFEEGIVIEDVIHQLGEHAGEFLKC